MAQLSNADTRLEIREAIVQAYNNSHARHGSMPPVSTSDVEILKLRGIGTSTAAGSQSHQKPSVMCAFARISGSASGRPDSLFIGLALSANGNNWTVLGYNARSLLPLNQINGMVAGRAIFPPLLIAAPDIGVGCGVIIADGKSTTLRVSLSDGSSVDDTSDRILLVFAPLHSSPELWEESTMPIFQLLDSNGIDLTNPTPLPKPS